MDIDLTKGAVRIGLQEAKSTIPKALDEQNLAERLSGPGSPLSIAQVAEAYVGYVYALRSLLHNAGIEFEQNEGPAELSMKAIEQLDQANDIGQLTGDYSQLEAQASLINGVKNASLEHRRKIAELTSGVSLLQGLERFEKDELLKSLQFDAATYQRAIESGNMPIPHVSSPPRRLGSFKNDRTGESWLILEGTSIRSPCGNDQCSER